MVCRLFSRGPGPTGRPMARGGADTLRGQGFLGALPTSQCDREKSSAPEMVMATGAACNSP